MTNATNQVLVEVTRGGQTESSHRGAICVCDADGEIIYSVGDVETPVYPRSAVKAIQALNIVESGAVEAFGLSQAEIAVMCSSHSGEEEHINTIRGILKKAGLSEDVLECGTHWSTQRPVLIEQARKYDDTPPAIYNNCSGKHTGFAITAKHLGIPIEGYVRPEHPIQQQVRKILFDVMGGSDSPQIAATDGCSIPTYAMPLSAMALGFARMMQGGDMPPARAKAAKIIVDACVENPFYVAGTKRFCTRYMEIGDKRLFAKTGAEGVFCGGVINKGLGIALKCDDGGTRASEIAMAAVTWKILDENDDIRGNIAEMSRKKLRNWNRIETGAIIPVFSPDFETLDA